MTPLSLISSPASSLSGELKVPGDKSISHRAILLGSLAKGTTVIHGFLDSEDCMATLAACKAMGVPIEGPDNQQVTIHGVGKYGLQKPKQIIDCKNSGTTMRLLAGLLAAQPFDSQLTGDESLLKRPMLRISKPLTLMGAQLSTQEGKPPLIIKGGKVLRGIDYLMPEASAQVKSCLLLAGMYAKGCTRITETAPTRDHTERMLKTYSYPIHRFENTIEINAQGQGLGTQIFIPGDISSAAFFLVAASIIPGSRICLREVGINSTRTGVIDLLRQMGADIRIVNSRWYGEEKVADLEVYYSPLRGIEIPAAMVPLAIDEFPILFIAAACARGVTTLQGAKELRFKESDRIKTMVEGLQGLGIKARELEEGVEIQGGCLHGGEVDSRGDHRIAMAFAVAGAAASAPVVIKKAQSIATSFPSFLDSAKALHCRIEEYRG